MTSALANKDRETAIAQPEQTRTGPVFKPHVDIIEHPNELLVIADIPGATSEAIELQFERGELTINAQIASRQAADASYLLSEYGVGAFQRTFRLGEGIDSNGITAEVSNGVLTLTLPKTSTAKSHTIEVKAK